MNAKAERKDTQYEIRRWDESAAAKASASIRANHESALKLTDVWHEHAKKPSSEITWTEEQVARIGNQYQIRQHEQGCEIA
jgi:hypothetical protein